MDACSKGGKFANTGNAPGDPMVFKFYGGAESEVGPWL